MKDERKIAHEIVRYLDILFGYPRCEWISEKKALEEFPFSLDMLRDMRGDATLEFRYHWKYIKKPVGERKRPGIIYHRARMIKFIDEL
ncbi:hypothetical protein [Chitinophaga cymbidii]|uniref:DNA-binding protein n=1 Tax=Chitinophaga cymbidii TaxID=1096750 RepID=A0A512RIR4_9BACT|nr:hypothetical protein [Chitinophaga cymbidii]GEP95577.1 hypothetical protein CCY01nite_18370 [Chitinophaga cymbidii]